ncbi:SUZ RNA-binding domain-containing isoform X2 [Procambarus clarkii]|uniref:SUZ RNA-binding domain-containing isoform X2 n=1 Tax=Procambarus clarkii TaxID=6728 RepID=UPI001E674DF7|nr:SUZ domain-containing protein 1-like isoform X2 [Procambarus clarkii]
MAAEQDDDLLDNWEDIDENSAVIEEHLEKLAIKNSQLESTMHSTHVVTCEDTSRTPFTPHEPKIMILRRPQEKLDSTPNGMISIKQKPVKTLEQRQQEYAEARLRILGDAGSSEENKPKPIQQKSLEQREADYAAARLRIMGSSSKSVEEPMLTGNSPGNHTVNIHKEPQNNVGVVRSPKGPDGTSGFSRGGGHHR